MTSEADLESTLGTALSDRVADLEPDLEVLAASSVRTGHRIRLRRRIGGSFVAAAAVAGVVGAVTLGSQLGHGDAARSNDPGFADASSSAAPSTPQHAGLRSLTGVRPLTGTLRELAARRRDVHVLRDLTPIGAAGAGPATSSDELAVLSRARNALAADRCGPIADDKFPCDGPTPYTVIARPIGDLGGWSIKGSVEAGQVAWTGKRWFLTVQGPTGHALDVLEAQVAAAER
ncbi:MAG: hypothetical protein FWE71_11295 [Nocardioidaceae bacterium]|nr:hypothetical protein [Nocardioidaceae bacterium]MCL2614906.1 hypothetical protein [Nocardioidaceae bacterium]